MLLYLNHFLYLSFSSSPLNCPSTLLCQSYRGLEWAWSSVKCIRNNSGRLSTPPILLLPCGSTLQLLDPSHPLSSTAASYQFLILSRHSSSSSSTWPRLPGDHQFFTPFKNQHCLPTPPTIDPPPLSSGLSRRPIRRHPIHQSSACDLLEVNGELHISFPSCIPRWSSTRGSGDQTSQRATVNGIPLKNHPFGHLLWNAVQEAGANGIGATTVQLCTILRQTPKRRASLYSQSPSIFQIFLNASLTAPFSSNSHGC